MRRQLHIHKFADSYVEFTAQHGSYMQLSCRLQIYHPPHTLMSRAGAAPPAAAKPIAALPIDTSKQQLDRMLELCRLPPASRSQQDLYYLRDRLHEASPFFRLWPPQLAAMVCRLARARVWAQHEVLAAQGTRPTDLIFVLAGEAAVAVRRHWGSSELRNVATLQRGDTCGELALLVRGWWWWCCWCCMAAGRTAGLTHGDDKLSFDHHATLCDAQHAEQGSAQHPAFVVARSRTLVTLLVSAAALADAMQDALQAPATQQQQQPAASMTTSRS